MPIELYLFVIVFQFVPVFFIAKSERFHSAEFSPPHFLKGIIIIRFTDDQ